MRFSNDVYNNSIHSIYRETYILNDKDKAYSVLLHSININNNSVSAYSQKLNSLVTFSVEDKDLNIIRKKLYDLPYNYQKCVNCHKTNYMLND